MAHGVAVGQGPQANTVWMTAGPSVLRWAPGGPNGAVTSYQLPPPATGTVSAEDALLVDPSGNVWVTEAGANVLAKLNPAGAGTSTQYVLPNYSLPNRKAQPFGLTAVGTNLWFTAFNASSIDRFPATGQPY